MWKRLSPEPPKCLLKDCDMSFDYRRIRQDHQKTRVWHCALCLKPYCTYTNLDGHYQKEHVSKHQCSFPDCGFTSKTRRQAIQHYEEQHPMPELVNNSEDNRTNHDTDEDGDLSGHEANSEENAQPINQGLTIPSRVTRSNDPQLQPSTSQSIDEVNISVAMQQNSSEIETAQLGDQFANIPQVVQQQPSTPTEQKQRRELSRILPTVKNAIKLT